MTVNPDLVQLGQDIPPSAAENPTSSTTAADVAVLNNFIANRYTRFEMIVFNLCAGYAASDTKEFRTDQEFAERVTTLARAIAYKMEEYGTT